MPQKIVYAAKIIISAGNERHGGAIGALSSHDMASFAAQNEPFHRAIWILSSRKTSLFIAR